MQVTSTVQTLLHMNYTITSAERRGEGNEGEWGKVGGL